MRSLRALGPNDRAFQKPKDTDAQRSQQEPKLDGARLKHVSGCGLS